MNTETSKQCAKTLSTKEDVFIKPLTLKDSGIYVEVDTKRF